MVNITFTTTLITISLHMLIIPHTPSKDNQAGQTSGSTVQNINVLHTFSMEPFYMKPNGKLHAHLLATSWGTVQATRRVLLCQNYFPWTIVKQFSGKHHHNCVNYKLCKVYQNEMNTMTEAAKLSSVCQ
jgi:hypothetical protein